VSVVDEDVGKRVDGAFAVLRRAEFGITGPGPFYILLDDNYISCTVDRTEELHDCGKQQYPYPGGMSDFVHSTMRSEPRLRGFIPFTNDVRGVLEDTDELTKKVYGIGSDLVTVFQPPRRFR
jgi:hypothetical protein